ncbi:MAG TPA: hypothetical protein V6D07_02725, partial [Trichocoleus sp.]
LFFLDILLMDNTMPKRKQNQKKPVKANHKSQRGIPEIYDQKKEKASYGLTPFGKSCITQQAESRSVSASQYIELIGREDLKVLPADQFALVQELVNEIIRITDGKSQEKNLNKALRLASQLLLNGVFILQTPVFILTTLLLSKGYVS